MTAFTPGSLAWLVAHDVRLNWRRFADMLGGKDGGAGRAIVLLVIGATVMHGLAWVLLPLIRGYVAGEQTTPESRVVVGAFLVCVFSWMTAQGLFGATRLLFERGDLDLLLGAPRRPWRVLAAKAGAVALSSLGSVALLLLPVANVGAVRDGVRWLAIYPLLGSFALLATAIAVAASIGLFHMVGPRRARLYAQIAGAGIGGAFVLGAQVIAMLPDRISGAIVAALAPPATGSTGLARFVWLPVDAALGKGSALLLLGSVALLAFLGAAMALGERFARACLEAAGAPAAVRSKARHKAARFRAGAAGALRRKEWRLLVRDPSLFAQLGLQIVYTIPLAVVLVRSGSLPLALSVTPAIVVIAAQVAASLAWIAVSGEDAPELIRTAPVKPLLVDAAKLSAIAVPVLMVASVPIAGLALETPRGALVALLFAAGASTATALLNLWHPMPGHRRGMLRRHSQSKLIGLVEHVLAVLFAIGAVLALLGSKLWVVAVVLAAVVLGYVKRAGGRRTRGDAGGGTMAASVAASQSPQQLQA